MTHYALRSWLGATETQAMVIERPRRHHRRTRRREANRRQWSHHWHVGHSGRP